MQPPEAFYLIDIQANYFHDKFIWKFFPEMRIINLKSCYLESF